MDYKQLRTARFMVAMIGGDLICHTPDGEVRWTLGLLPGIHKGADLLPFVEEADLLEWTDGITPLLSNNRAISVQNFGKLAVKSGANPDFKPTVYSVAEVRMRKLLDEVQAATDGLEKRKASFAQASPASSDDGEEPVVEVPEDGAEGGTGTEE
jgi:hypothetical protein